MLDITKIPFTFCRSCSLIGHEMVFYDILGNTSKHQADFMFIGINPGKNEIKYRYPFTGPSGKFLRQMISETDLLNYKIIFTNAILCSTRSEKEIGNIKKCIENCKPNLDKIISIFSPKIYIPVGRSVSQYVFNITGSIKENSGKLFNKNVIPLIHPAAILRARNKENVNLFKNSLNQLLTYLK